MAISKTQTFEVGFNQTVITVQDASGAVEKAYKRVVGIALLARGSTTQDVRIKVFTDAQTYLDWAPLTLYAAGTDYPVMARFIPVDIPIHGQNFFFQVQMNAVGTGTGIIDAVFALSNSKG